MGKAWKPGLTDHFRYAINRGHWDNCKNSHTQKLLDLGYIEHHPQVVGHGKYTATPAGLLWWTQQQLLEKDKGEHYAKWLASEPPELVDRVFGKGIGSTFRLHLFEAGAVYKSIVAGYLELVEIHWGYVAGTDSLESVTVKLTAAGMAYFDSLPKLQFECA